MDISGTQLRTVRAALFTAVVVTLSTASHVLLSRAPLPVATVTAVATGVFVTAYALAGRERGTAEPVREPAPGGRQLGGPRDRADGGCPARGHRQVPDRRVVPVTEVGAVPL
ncbi:hypothetical protein ACN6LA_004871, partial [Streptomyces sp. SAS_269]